MFQKITSTKFPPSNKPVMVWDGHCGFCRYWTIRWKKITKNRVEYRPFQDAASDFNDIDIKHFKQASRLIETDGAVYSGPHSAYRTLTYGSKWAFLDKWYQNISWFQKLSDGAYNWVAKNRNFMFKLTKALYGSDPESIRPFWVIYLFIALYFVYSIIGLASM